MSGATHSHDAEFPDDDWNLYSQLDPSTTTGLNVTNQSDVVGIFKPFALRLNDVPTIYSDADEEVMIIARFISPVHIRKLCIIGGGDDESQHPDVLKCYVNHQNIDFLGVNDIAPSQQFTLPVNRDGSVELVTALRPFTNVLSLAFYFPSNHGSSDVTAIKYIGMQGEHTHFRREAVNAMYEVLCNGQDIEQPDDVLGAHAPHMH